MFSAAPAFVVRPVAAAAALLDAHIPFVKCNFEFNDSKRIGDGDAMLGFSSSKRLGGRGTHGEWMITIRGQPVQSLNSVRTPATFQMAGDADTRCSGDSLLRGARAEETSNIVLFLIFAMRFSIAAARGGPPR